MVKSLKQCAAWIVWNLDRHSDHGDFKSARPVDWIEDGRENRKLLPWVKSMAEFNSRPQCIVQRDWLRLALRTLGEYLASLPDTTGIVFRFDGSVLSVRFDKKVIALPGEGSPWTVCFRVEAGTLRRLPKRLMRERIGVSIWESQHHAWQLHIRRKSRRVRRNRLFKSPINEDQICPKKRVQWELKPAIFPFVDTLLNIVIKEFPVKQRFACYNCGTHKSSKLLSAGTAPSGKKIRICLTCREHYIQFFVRKMIDKVIVPVLVREVLESLKPSANTPPSTATTPPRASAELPKKTRRFRPHAYFPTNGCLTKEANRR